MLSKNGYTCINENINEEPAFLSPYLHAYALRFHLSDEAFEFVVPPDERERFMSAECKGQIVKYPESWREF